MHSRMVCWGDEGSENKTNEKKCTKGNEAQRK